MDYFLGTPAFRTVRLIAAPIICTMMVYEYLHPGEQVLYLTSMTMTRMTMMEPDFFVSTILHSHTVYNFCITKSM